MVEAAQAALPEERGRGAQAALPEERGRGAQRNVNVALSAARRLPRKSNSYHCVCVHMRATGARMCVCAATS